MTVTLRCIREMDQGEYIGRRNPHRGLRQSPLYADIPDLERYRRWLENLLGYEGSERREVQRLTEIARHGDLVLLVGPNDRHGEVVRDVIEKALVGLTLW
jgi:hypothetical protein